ncbi:hypothetical protein CLAIMM_11470 [Cladophialophora immunda]|nr:hypothetical protein CLAIMM_11470 [Cladophialophora immunda]
MTYSVTIELRASIHGDSASNTFSETPRHLSSEDSLNVDPARHRNISVADPQISFQPAAMSQIPIYNDKFLEKLSLKGKSIVITGGARGLGLAFCSGLAQAGANVAVIDIAEQPSSSFCSLDYGGKYRYYRGDVTDYEGFSALIHKIADDFGTIHGCIAAAGTAIDKPFLEHTPRDIQITLDLNVKGVFCTMQHVAQVMKERGTSGSIVVIASSASYKHPAAGTLSAYTASKFAVRGLVGSVARELATFGVRVNSVSPGSMETELLQQVLDQDPNRRKVYASSCALNRLGRPEELCGMMLYLMSDLASFTTGQDFLIDGSSV